MKLTTEFLPCGVYLDTYGDLQVILGKDAGTSNKKTLMVNNDPAGVTEIYGMQDLEIQPCLDMDFVNKTVDAGGLLEFGKLLQENKYFKEMQEIVCTKSRGEYVAAVLLEDGFLLVKDLEFFEADTQGFDISSTKAAYNGKVITGEVDDIREFSSVIGYYL